MRTFIAIELPANIQKQVYQVQLQLQASLQDLQIARCIRWTPVTQIHLTLRFLGETNPIQQESLARHLKQTTLHPTAFRLSLGGIGCFPDFRKPSVVWLGVGGEVGELQQLQAKIERLAQTAGFVAEKRPFSPHLTLGRARRDSSPVELRRVGEALKNFQSELETQRRAPVVLDSFAVTQIVHMQSELRPEGARHTPVMHYLLG